MKFQVKKLELLLSKAVQKTGKSFNHADFADMTAEINAAIFEKRQNGVVIGEKYVYDNIYRKFKKMDALDELSLNQKYVDTIARYAGFRNFQGFEEFLLAEVETKDEVILRCGGVWKSYVRTNSGRAELLVAPLHIVQEGGKTVIKMKGEGDVVYDADLTLKGGCLRCLLDGGKLDDRQIYMVMRLGVAAKPEVLLGIFGGMSNGGMPIGGREVWIRMEEGMTFEELSHEVIDMEKEADKLNEYILYYFKDRYKNCWKGTLPSSFDIRDLKND